MTSFVSVSPFFTNAPHVLDALRRESGRAKVLAMSNSGRQPSKARWVPAPGFRLTMLYATLYKEIWAFNLLWGADHAT